MTNNKLDRVNRELTEIRDRKEVLHKEYVVVCEKRIRILLEEYGLFEGMDVYFPVRGKKRKCKLSVQFKFANGSDFRGKAYACVTPYGEDGELWGTTFIVEEYEYFSLERVEYVTR